MGSFDLAYSKEWLSNSLEHLFCSKFYDLVVCKTKSDVIAGIHSNYITFLPPLYHRWVGWLLQADTEKNNSRVPVACCVWRRTVWHVCVVACAIIATVHASDLGEGCLLTSRYYFLSSVCSTHILHSIICIYWRNIFALIQKTALLQLQ